MLKEHRNQYEGGPNGQIWDDLRNKINHDNNIFITHGIKIMSMRPSHKKLVE